MIELKPSYLYPVLSWTGKTLLYIVMVEPIYTLIFLRTFLGI